LYFFLNSTYFADFSSVVSSTSIKNKEDNGFAEVLEDNEKDTKLSLIVRIELDLVESLSLSFRKATFLIHIFWLLVLRDKSIENTNKDTELLDENVIYFL